MTFIGIQCTRNAAEIVADSASYLDRGTKFAEVSKVDTYPHLDAAFTASGQGMFSYWAHRIARDASLRELSFDDWVKTAPEWLGAALEITQARLKEQTPGEQESAVVFLIGYSHREKGYTAFSATMEALDPKRIEGLHIQPTPLSKRPSQEEVDFLREEVRLDDSVPNDAAEPVIDTWTAKPPPVVNGANDWIKLAQAARNSRSLSGSDFMRVHVAGSLYLTHMKRGSIRTNRLLTFNDTGDELRLLLADTRHPVAQISPCGVCDSGKPALDCCLQDEFDEPCACRSGKTFGDCCVVTDRDAVPDRLWT